MIFSVRRDFRVRDYICRGFVGFRYRTAPGTIASVKWFFDDDCCVNDDCDCDDTECPKVSIDDDEIGCECCCDI